MRPNGRFIPQPPPKPTYNPQMVFHVNADSEAYRWLHFRCPECRKAVVTVVIRTMAPALVMNTVSCESCSKKQHTNVRMPLVRLPFEQWPLTMRRAPDAVWDRVEGAKRSEMRFKNPILFTYVQDGGLILRPFEATDRAWIGWPAEWGPSWEQHGAATPTEEPTDGRGDEGDAGMGGAGL